MSESPEQAQQRRDERNARERRSLIGELENKSIAAWTAWLSPGPPEPPVQDWGPFARKLDELSRREQARREEMY